MRCADSVIFTAFFLLLGRGATVETTLDMFEDQICEYLTFYLKTVVARCSIRDKNKNATTLHKLEKLDKASSYLASV